MAWICFKDRIPRDHMRLQILDILLSIPKARLSTIADSGHHPFYYKGKICKNGLWKFEIDKSDIQTGYNLNKLWAKEKIDEIMFHNAIGLLDAGTYERKITDLALEHSLVTKFTSLVAVDDQISRKQEDLLTTHQIPQNIPDGWVEPNIPNLKDSSENSGLPIKIFWTSFTPKCDASGLNNEFCEPGFRLNHSTAKAVASTC